MQQAKQAAFDELQKLLDAEFAKIESGKPQIREDANLRPGVRQHPQDGADIDVETNGTGDSQPEVESWRVGEKEPDAGTQLERPDAVLVSRPGSFVEFYAIKKT